MKKILISKKQRNSNWMKKLACIVLAFVMLVTSVGIPEALLHPVNAETAAEKVLDEKIEVYDKTVTKTYKQYDITGDGKADIMKVKAKGNEGTSEGEITVFINGKKAYHKAGYIYDWIVCLYKPREGKPWLAISSSGSANETFCVLLKYKSGKLVQQPIKLEQNCCRTYANELRITPKKIVAGYENGASCWLGTYFMADYTYTLKNGKWKISKYGTNFRRYMGEKIDKFKVLKKFTAYKGVNSKKAAFTVKAGEEVRPKKCRYYKGELYIQLSYKGKTGWIQDKYEIAGTFE